MTNELKHFVNNARQNLIGAEELLSKANSIETLEEIDQYVTRARQLLQDCEERIARYYSDVRFEAVMRGIDANIEEIKRLSEVLNAKS